MSTELWIEGVIIEFKNGHPCNRAIIRKVGRHEIVLADIVNGKVFKIDRTKLDVEKENGDLKLLAESRDFGELTFIDLSERDQLEVNRRYKYIKKLKENNITKITAKSAQSLNIELAKEIDEEPPHWQSVRGWQKKFVDAGEKMRGLYPRHRYKGDRSSRLNIRVVEIIEAAAERYYKPNRPSLSSIVRNIEGKIIAHNLDNPHDLLTMPSYLTIQRRVTARSYQKKQKSRTGSRSFEAELAGTKSGVETTCILERVEIDHTQIDLHVLHDDHKTLLGRPYITALIDHYSHVLHGFQLSFEPPSFASVCIACINAFLPKASSLESVNVTGAWPAHGVPVTVVSDNANEFWGKSFEAVSDEIGSKFQYCPIRKGRYKSRIERFFGIMNAFVLDDLPGVVRKIGKCGEDYDPRQDAVMTFSEFKHHFLEWLVDVYHNTPLDNGMTPNELWHLSEKDFPVPAEEEMELLPILMETETRKLVKGQIQIFNLSYSSSILKDVYRRDGPVEVKIKYNPFDIGYILVFDSLNNIYLNVPCDDYSYASGLSVYEHDKIRAAANQLKQSKLDNPDLQRAKVKLAKERDELHARNSRRKNQTTAAKAARSEQIGVGKIKIVVDNTKGLIRINEDEDDSLSLEGWCVE
jgi:putative transposase